MVYLAWNSHPKMFGDQKTIPWALSHLCVLLSLLCLPRGPKQSVVCSCFIQLCSPVMWASQSRPARLGSVSRDQEALFHPRSQPQS